MENNNPMGGGNPVEVAAPTPPVQIPSQAPPSQNPAPAGGEPKFESGGALSDIPWVTLGLQIVGFTALLMATTYYAWKMKTGKQEVAKQQGKIKNLEDEITELKSKQTAKKAQTSTGPRFSI